MALGARGMDRPFDAGVELAPPRTYSGWSMAMLWGGLSMSLLAFLPGAYLVPALTLRDAVLVSLAGSIAGAALLAGIAAIAAKRRQNTIGLLSSALGMRVAPALAVLLFLRHLCWALFTIAFASEAASHVPALGGERWPWAIALGALAIALALLPKHVFVGRWMAWFAFWVGLVIVAAVTATGVTTYGLPMLHEANGLGGWPTRAQGFDLVAAMPLLWLPIVADFAMDARSPRAAALGTGIGTGAMTAWYAIVGTLWVFTVSAADVASFITALPIGAAAIVIVIALEADATAANLHAASLAGGRFGYRWFTPALLAAGVAAAGLALAFDGLAVEDALAMLGSIFLPLLSVVVAREVFGAAPRAYAWVAWLVGSLAYGWINPAGFAPWRDALEFVFATVLRLPFPLGGEQTPIPATLVAFAAAVAVYGAGALVARGRGQAHG